MGKLVYLLIFLTLCLTSTLTEPIHSKISPTLESRLKSEGKVNILIKLRAKTANVLQTVRESRYANREQRLNSLHDLLVNNADRTQKNIIQFLETKSRATKVEFKSFWITNQIYVKGANEALVQQLVVKFPNDIESVYSDGIVAYLTIPMDERNVTKTDIRSNNQWGHEKIQVYQAWEKLGFHPGAKNDMPELVIGTLDTGVRSSHEALRDNFVGEYGWFDAVSGEPEPHDKMGHGTHTTATIAGSHGIGVAPWVKWMSCRGCPTLGCSMANLLECGEFMLCPTLPDGSNPNCSKAPRIISNSWSAGPLSTWYDDVIDAWTAAEIIAVFSIGNMGNAFCGSAYYPGDRHDTIGVGSTTKDDDISWFSSIGPTKTFGDRIKPDIVAPGSDILSADHTADDKYALMSGTSMSCPHVSGIVAMLITQNPEITFAEVRSAIVGSTAKNLRSRNLTCLDVPDTVYPNYVYGYGQVNALRSLERARN